MSSFYGSSFVFHFALSPLVHVPCEFPCTFTAFLPRSQACDCALRFERYHFASDPRSFVDCTLPDCVSPSQHVVVMHRHHHFLCSLLIFIVPPHTLTMFVDARFCRPLYTFPLSQQLFLPRSRTRFRKTQSFHPHSPTTSPHFVGMCHPSLSPLCVRRSHPG